MNGLPIAQIFDAIAKAVQEDRIILATPDDGSRPKVEIFFDTPAEVHAFAAGAQRLAQLLHPTVAFTATPPVDPASATGRAIQRAAVASISTLRACPEVPACASPSLAGDQACAKCLMPRGQAIRAAADGEG